jgi:hypothetical protein
MRWHLCHWWVGRAAERGLRSECGRGTTGWAHDLFWDNSCIFRRPARVDGRKVNFCDKLTFLPSVQAGRQNIHFFYRFFKKPKKVIAADGRLHVYCSVCRSLILLWRQTSTSGNKE